MSKGKKSKKKRNRLPFEPTWKQNWENRRYHGRAATVTAIAGVVILVLMFVAGCMVVALYEPTPRENAVPMSVEFSSYYHNSLPKGTTRYILSTTDGDRLRLDGAYINGTLTRYLYSLPKGAELELLLDRPNGTVLEITRSGREILNFDYAQKMIKIRNWFFFGIGVACLIGSVFCAIYAIKKIVNEKIFAPSPYKEYKPPKKHKKHKKKKSKKDSQHS